jgi:predicted MFS family arabinose efflux permease
MPFILNGFVLLITSAFFLTLKETPKDGTIKGIKGQLEHFKASLTYSWSNKKLLWYIFFFIFSGFTAWIFHDMMRSPFYESIGYPIAILGVLTAIITAVRSAFSLYAHKIESLLGINGSIYLILFGQAPLFFLMYYFYSWIAFLFVIALYCIWSLQEVLSEVYSHEHMTSKQRATLVSIQSFYNSIAILAGSLIAGFVIEAYSLRLMMLFLGMASLVAGIIMVMTRRRVSGI